MPESVYNAPKQSLPNRHRNYPAGSADCTALSYFIFIGKYGNRNGFVFKILSHSEAAVIKFEQLSCHAVAKAIHTRNAISNKNHISCLGHLDSASIILYLLFYNTAYLIRSCVHFSGSFLSCKRLHKCLKPSMGRFEINMCRRLNLRFDCRITNN